MEHFPAVCCFGGEPFLDFHTNSSIDPTDWSADLVQDPVNFNFTEKLAQLGILEVTQCQLFNITFNDVPDQTLFDTFKANFMCRCAFGYSGSSCELHHEPIEIPPASLALSSQHTLSLPPDPMVMLLVIAAVLLALMGVLAMMVKGCFCDCFGPMTREDPYDKPLDPEDVRKCLQKVRENQAAREMAREPLVSHPPPQQGVPPMVLESFSAPYSQAPPTSMVYPSAPIMPYRSSSPPPAYSTIDKASAFQSSPI